MNVKNHVQLIGHFGQNPEYFPSESGNHVAKVSLATNDSYKNKNGEKVTVTEWHNLVVFGSLAEIVNKFCSKGQNVVVTGSLKTRKYLNKENIEKYTTEIIVSDIVFLDKKQ
jgi:single-strand DNA-binding protein